MNDDDQKRRPRKSGPGRAPAKGGAKKPYRKKAEAADSAERPKRAWKPREGGADRDERKPFRKDDGGKPSYRPRSEAEAADSAERPKREWKPREGDADRGERKPFRRNDGGKPPYRPRREAEPRGEGTDRPKRAWKPREGDADRGERKPFRRNDGGDRKPFRSDAERKPFRERDDAGPSRKPRDVDRKRERAEVSEPGERIAKRLARAGISSRREAEAMIADGRVRVNGQVLSTPAFNVSAADTILVDNHPLPAIERTRLFLFHKPAGVVTTNRDPEGRRTVFEVLPSGLPRLMTVGRLDINTEGLLLLTNDGGLSRVLELPATGWLRRYRARVHGKVDEKALQSLKDGIAVDGVFYGSIEATLDREQGSNAWLTLGLREGKNREVKNVLGALGLEVSRLIRISYGPFQLGELEEGAVHELKGRTLRDQLGERLIEEAGADFDAPVAAEFPNRPVTRGNEPPPKSTRPRFEEAGEGGLIRNRKREREHRREDALDRLQTKPAGRGGGKPAGKRERTEKPFEPPRSRSSNVWMAPGARPQGKKAEAETASSHRPRDEGKGEGQRRPNRADAGFRGPADKRGSRPPSGPRKGKPPRKDR